MEEKIWKEFDKSLKILLILLTISVVLNLVSFHFTTSILQLFLIFCIYFFDSRFSQSEGEVLKRYSILSVVIIIVSFLISNFMLTIAGIWLLSKSLSIFLGSYYNLLNSKGFFALTEIFTILLSFFAALIIIFSVSGAFVNMKSVTKEFNKINLNDSMSDVKFAIGFKKMKQDSILSYIYKVEYSSYKNIYMELYFDSKDKCYSKSLHYDSEYINDLFGNPKISFANFYKIKNDFVDSDYLDFSEIAEANTLKYEDLVANLGVEGTIIKEYLPSYADLTKFLISLGISEQLLKSESEYLNSSDKYIQRTYIFANTLDSYIKVKTFGKYVIQITGYVFSEDINLTFDII